MTTPVDATSSRSKPKTRRALLAGALGGLGAVAASAIGRVSPAQAANGDPVLLGQVNSATSNTQVTKTTNGGIAIRGTASSGGSGVSGDGGATGVSGSGSLTGVEGSSAAGTGVVAVSSTGTGLFATTASGIGLAAFSNAGVAISAESSSNYALHAVSLQATASRLQTNSQFGAGVEVEVNHTTNGRGAIEAYHKGNGPAVWATATNGYAVRGSGRLRFEKVSGVAAITAGSTTKTITPGVDVNAGSFVLLTPKANIGSRALWFTTNGTANTFTIRMSSARTSTTRVAWLLLG